VGGWGGGPPPSFVFGGCPRRETSFHRFLHRLLLHSRFAHISRSSRFTLCACLLVCACMVHFLFWLRRGLSRRIRSLLHRLFSHGARIPIVIARLRIPRWHTRDQPSSSYHDCQST